MYNNIQISTHTFHSTAFIMI